MESYENISRSEIESARARISPFVRHTPLLRAQPIRQKFLPPEAELYFKLENLQVTGSFKARGAVNKLYTLKPDELARGIVTASGGNHGLGVAYAGWLASIPVTIYLPENTPPAKLVKLTAWGANVIMAGLVWDEANQIALEHAERTGQTYFHPFADRTVIAGQGTIGLEILEDLTTVDTVLVAIGGGGLISGVSIALKEHLPGVKIIGVEPYGAATLHNSLKAGHPVELTTITTTAGTLAPRLTTELNLNIVKRYVDEVILVSDEEMLQAARWLWFEMGIAAELSGAAALAVLLSGKLVPLPGEKICSIVCGAGTDGLYL